MLDLNDVAAIHAADSHHLLDQILNLSQHLSEGWAVAKALELPVLYGALDSVVIAGAGDAIESGALFAALANVESPIPIHLVSDYDLPAFAHDARTLVIALSGERAAEETQSIIEQAHARQCQVLIMSKHHTAIEPDKALEVEGYAALGALLNIASRLGWVHDLAVDFTEAVEVTQAWSSAASPRCPPPASRSPNGSSRKP